MTLLIKVHASSIGLRVIPGMRYVIDDAALSGESMSLVWAATWDYVDTIAGDDGTFATVTATPFSDGVATSDSYDTSNTYLIGLTDAASVTDAHACHVSVGVVTDAVNTYDSLFVIGDLYTYNDAASADELVVTSNAFSIPGSDAAVVSEDYYVVMLYQQQIDGRSINHSTMG